MLCINGAKAQAPTITSFSPMTAGPADTITITGTNFMNVQEVRCGSVLTSHTVVSPTTIKTVIGASMVSGTVSVKTVDGTATVPGYVWNGYPVITSVVPNSGRPGDTILITGKYLAPGGFGPIAPTVSFGGVAAADVIALSYSAVKVVVGNGASGSISLASCCFGSTTYPGFTFIGHAPIINSFAPAKTGTGATVVIKGKYLTSTTSVKFGETNAASFTIISDTVINAVVGAGANGDITVTNLTGTVTSPGFIYVSHPLISSFTPATAAKGDIVTIKGVYFTNVASVKFGGVAASSFTVVADSIITAKVAAGASGAIAITAPGGIDSLGGFTYSNPPVIISFSPVKIGTGGMVTIKGKNFSYGVTSVKFGGVAANSFTVVSDSIITAIVGVGASGDITV
ncbi:MAG: IPT/TIG domain-containing protein, partial [Sphingobacteriales bacterium]|nr:IPT/TIG domain-containing protein [Sphingobacteriales bacterium]